MTQSLGLDESGEVSEEKLGERESEDQPEPVTDSANSTKESEEDTPQSDQSEDFSRGVKRRREARSMRKNVPALVGEKWSRVKIGWIAWAAFILLTMVTLVFARQALVETWPPISGLYLAVGVSEETLWPRPVPAEEFVSFTGNGEAVTEGDRLDFSMSGNFTNSGDRTVILPAIKGALNNTAGLTIYEWQFNASQAAIAPGETVEFANTVNDIPSGASGWKLTPLWPESEQRREE